MDDEIGGQVKSSQAETRFDLSWVGLGDGKKGSPNPTAHQPEKKHDARGAKYSTYRVQYSTAV